MKKSLKTAGLAKSTKEIVQFCHDCATLYQPNIAKANLAIIRLVKEF